MGSGEGTGRAIDRFQVIVLQAPDVARAIQVQCEALAGAPWPASHARLPRDLVAQIERLIDATYEDVIERAR